MLCPNCETEVPDSSFFCAECGADVVPVGDVEAADDACGAVSVGDPFPRMEEGLPPSTHGVKDDGRHGEENPELSGAAPSEDAPADPPAEDAVPVSARREDRKDLPRAGPEAAAGDLWKDRCAPDDGTQGDGYSAVPADDAAAGPQEPVPAPEDNGRIRIREGGTAGPRRRVPMPYDPMEDFLGESPPENPPVRRNGEDPGRRVPLPAIGVLIAVVLVVIAVALFVAGGGLAGDAVSTSAASGPVPAVTADTPAATSAPEEQMAAFTGSIVLMVTPTFDGYRAVVTGGSRISEVAMVAITVEDKAGVHTMEWYYPYRGESFVLMRGMYGGIRAQTERVTAEATFAGGQKELIWDEEY